MLDIFNSILWSIAIIFLLGGGIFLSIKFKFVQFNIIKIIKSLKKETNQKISLFKSLSMSLAARIGVGSLSGIALAIYIGGPGTIFWIWISSIIISINAYIESYLGMIYREKDNDIYNGGPYYYISKGLKKIKLAKIYAILIIIAYIFAFIPIQSNTITTSINNIYNIDKVYIGLIIGIITFLSIVKGAKEIANITSKLVPIMGISYLLIGIYILIKNINKIGIIIMLIIKSAFDIKTFGIGVISTFIIGIQRGIFSTEAGLGSGVIAASTTDSNDKNKVGYSQIFGIYFTSLIICTITALIILTSDYNTLTFNNLNGIEITQYALHYHLNKLGDIILILSIMAFAFSTIIAGYYYGESSLKYLDKKITKSKINILKILTVFLIIIGSTINSDIIWNNIDILTAFMAIINMYSVLKLYRGVST